jgi:hypothetical protein
MIPKSVQRFSEKIMRKRKTGASQRAKASCAAAALPIAGRAGTF